jgi:NAD(P)H-hydrate repair Nnr-like enzyme with NAD(P)H-hydrate dehydratase domain
MSGESAAVAAAYLHGAAGESLAARLGDAGLLAGELADEIPIVRRALVQSQSASRETWTS